MEENRTEAATPRRREKARSKGQVAKSMEINIALSLFVGVLTLRLIGGTTFNSLNNITREIFYQLPFIQINQHSVHVYTLQFLPKLFLLVAPLMAVLLIIGVAANYIQVGFLFTLEPLIPKLERLSPVKGASNLFSKRRLVELLKSIFKLTVIGYIGYAILVGAWANFNKFPDMEIKEIVAYTGGLAFKIAFSISTVLLLLAIFDYAYQRWEHEQSLKMTKREVMEDWKEVEGDPQIRSRIRRMQLEMAGRRMMQEVPEADAVVVNPHSIAVAIKYDQSPMTAPKVVAKGARLLAERIKSIAKEAGVPIVEDRPLAQTLYKNVKVGEEIPEKLYKAVAEILVYVYQLNQKKKQGPLFSKAKDERRKAEGVQ